ncbi:hypothetical protein XaC1_481 [Xanthomonas phage XaC1]|nr:hypothetical protein XaC1_481 [Xanthomonas phage XaC1]
MNAQDVLHLLKNHKKHFYYAYTKKTQTTKSNKYLKKAKAKNFGSVRAKYFKKAREAIRVMPYHSRSDEFTVSIQLMIDMYNYLQISISNSEVHLYVFNVRMPEPIDLYYGKTGLERDDFFSISLTYNIPQLVLSTEIAKLRRDFPKKLRQKYFQMNNGTVKKFETF